MEHPRVMCVMYQWSSLDTIIECLINFLIANWIQKILKEPDWSKNPPVYLKTSSLQQTLYNWPGSLLHECHMFVNKVVFLYESHWTIQSVQFFLKLKVLAQLMLSSKQSSIRYHASIQLGTTCVESFLQTNLYFSQPLPFSHLSLDKKQKF